MSMITVLKEVVDERNRQDAKWGEQNHPDGTGLPTDRLLATDYRKLCQLRAEQGTLTWSDISREEMAEAYAESEPTALRYELIQQAAVIIAWIEAIDRRIK